MSTLLTHTPVLHLLGEGGLGTPELLEGLPGALSGSFVITAFLESNRNKNSNQKIKI